LATHTLIAGGLADKEIAVRLGVSVRTAEFHVERIRTKLGFTSRAQIAAWAVRHEREPYDGRTAVQLSGVL